jgi:hypothetical protein
MGISRDASHVRGCTDPRKSLLRGMPTAEVRKYNCYKQYYYACVFVQTYTSHPHRHTNTHTRNTQQQVQ